MQTEIWAHRGSSRKYIENTLAAFKQAIADQADGIELDVQRTQDNQLVVIHDENLLRLAGVDKFVWEVTWEEMQAMSLLPQAKINAEDARIPLLEEVLALMKATELTVNIELKNSIHFYPGMEAAVVELVEQMNMADQVIYSSFNHESVQRLTTLTQPEKCALLTSDILFEPWNYLKSLNTSIYHPMINSLQQKSLIEKCRQQGIRIHVWTADLEEHIYAALLLGVDALITNRPDEAIKLRRQFESDDGQRAAESVKQLGFSL